MFILYSNIVKDDLDCEQNVKGFHMTIHQIISNTFGGTIHHTISNTFGGTIHQTISNTFGWTIHQTISNTFGWTIHMTVHAHLPVSHPFTVIPLISG